MRSLVLAVTLLACTALASSATPPAPASAPAPVEEVLARVADLRRRVTNEATEAGQRKAADEMLAARAELSGECELAQALRRRDTSLLRKRHLLYLAHAWGLRSDLWRRKQRVVKQEVEEARTPPPK